MAHDLLLILSREQIPYQFLKYLAGNTEKLQNIYYKHTDFVATSKTSLFKTMAYIKLKRTSNTPN